MTRLTSRKRLRRLRTWLYGKPQLVVPAIVIGGHRDRDPQRTSGATEEEFLWGMEWTRERSRLRLSPGPSDAEWAEQYKAYRDGHVTYDATTARKRLLRLTHQEKLCRPTVFSVEESPQVAIKTSTKEH